MQSESSAGDSDSGLPAVRYYKSEHLSPPLIYVQAEGAWMSLWTDGTVLAQEAGRIPEEIRGRIAEIDEAEASRLFPGGLPDPTPPQEEEPDEEDPDADEDDDLADDEATDIGVAFKPRLRRYILGKALQLVLIIGCTTLFVRLAIARGGRDPAPDIRSQGAWIIYYFYGLAVFGVILNTLREYFRSRDGFVMRVSGTTVTGPQKWWWGRKQTSLRRAIPLDRLDRARSARRAPIDRLLGRQYLYSVSGERICLPRWLFARADLRRLIGVLGLGS